jgi:MATE family multidrug resistance protein
MLSTAVAGEGTPASPRLVRAEALATLKLAGPLAATQLAQMAINTTDVLLLGWLGPEPLAAASLGLALFFFLFMFGLGVVSATSPLFSQAVGAGRPLRVRRVLQQGFLLVLGISLPLMLVMGQARPILLALGQDPALLDTTRLFILGLLWGLPAMLGVVLLRCFTTAFGAGRPVLAATLIVVPLNAVLAYGLIFGAFGLPRLEVLGSGIASALAHAAMFLILLAWCLLSPRFRRYILPLRLRPDLRLLRELLAVGLPIGGAGVMETGLFAGSGLLMGLIGTVPLAAHQVTLQICATFFMVPLGIGFAATIRVGRAHGAGDRAGARRAGFVASVLGAGFMLGVALLFWLGARPMIALFLDTATPEAAATAALAVTLLHVAILFQLFDGLQVIGISSLRGLGDTRVPMLLAAFGYWAVGFPVAAGLGHATPLGPIGVWLGLAVALAIVASLMLARFNRLTSPLRLG